ncbi:MULTISPECIES: YgiQ family radical SAM protein [unclassified Clostridioides]|uniref:YgiQ family radical SAM protein n=1 Tax=unclassified Clostridioides TaxID=2635829 RepID=UPI001D11F898|nr:YgiQ family radical SAM protein [Clostridioides sp. ZZV14-6150]MCC0662084.1 YgiQ family radical SAM protein [Clostridioides sp. ZZV14-6154]MCC0669873.1 YgiQ family radical SAM protein [Clostridioides sp. ZZV14-6153]MCC0719775.1 YgiQ family radical SAM protein [Clostridioides sp. ZZV14-6105]MCC0722155.1 YgiQ family radical SAM protein [Clostridioides sp. ZZV14-6104]MCC0728244.1 YgiQ family radical SAM protein [Clostridioides sp. ZZV14-6045]MCC0732190.1 YgiQ family radical SAM protein [Clost
MENRFLPISKQDMIDRGWEELDFVLVTGDAYVDHHSFGTAIISRVLENAGYKVGIIAQPNWKTTDDFMKLGKPRLGFLVNAGNMDSMVNHYSVSKKHRDKDMYSPGGKMGYRPDRATIVYCNKIREAYSDVAIVIGGIEASLRRFAHYDYWSDKVRKSMLIDSGADLLVYGMSEKQIVDVANALNDGYDPKYIRHIDGTCYVSDTLEEIYDNYILIPSYKEICEDKMKYVEAFKIQYDEQDPFRGNIIVQPHGSKYLVQNKPEKPLNREELDEVYGLPYQKTYHPVYEKSGGIPAIEEVKFSIVSSRGCFGSCSFCAITFHQGRAVQSRSEKSIIDEAVGITKLNDFKGYIHDVGGPTANFRRPACNKQITKGACKNRQCLSPSPCKNLDADHSEYLHLLRAVRKLPNIKKVFVRSGIRYDYVMADKNNKFLRELIEHHVSGQLKVAPEHISEEVLEYMQKPAGKTYDKFRQKFFAINEELGKKQYLIPYLMSSHPGSTLNSAIELAEYLRDTHYQPEQVQDFYPTPGTLSTTMFYTGIDPLTMKPVYVPKSKRDKAMQRALLQYRAPRNYDLVYSALVEAGREDLIGFGHRCLIKPKDEKPYFNRNNSNKNKSKTSTENKKHNANNRNNKKQQKSPSKRKKKY